MEAEPDPDQVTRLLQRASAGDAAARSQLAGVLYDELRRAAARQLRGSEQGTLQPTALVHEAWLRLMSAADGGGFESRGHFLAVAARAMRSVVVDHVRARRTAKRGAGIAPSRLDDVVAYLESDDTDLLDLHAALDELERDDPELARIVEMRFFGGLGQSEIASGLGVSLSTVERGWRVARARLHRRLHQEPGR